MFPEVGATELLVIAAVALIVVGPKDLPVLMRKVGRFLARMRGMAAEFRASFDEMARQSELDELRREVDALRAGQYMTPLDASGSAHEVFQDIHSELTAPAASPAAIWPIPEEEAAAVAKTRPRIRSAPAKTPVMAAAKTTAKPKAATKPKVLGKSATAKTAVKPKATPKAPTAKVPAPKTKAAPAKAARAKAPARTTP